jgi:hypothetical protein
MSELAAWAGLDPRADGAQLDQWRRDQAQASRPIDSGCQKKTGQTIEILTFRTYGLRMSNKTANLQSVHQHDLAACTVFHCTRDGQSSWISSTAWRGWPCEWVVCQEHDAKLRADHDWQIVQAQPPGWHRWILMGDDISTQPNGTHERLRPRTSATSADRFGLVDGAGQAAR